MGLGWQLLARLTVRNGLQTNATRLAEQTVVCSSLDICLLPDYLGHVCKLDVIPALLGVANTSTTAHAHHSVTKEEC